MTATAQSSRLLGGYENNIELPFLRDAELLYLHESLKSGTVDPPSDESEVTTSRCDLEEFPELRSTVATVRKSDWIRKRKKLVSEEFVRRLPRVMNDAVKVCQTSQDYLALEELWDLESNPSWSYVFYNLKRRDLNLVLLMVINKAMRVLAFLKKRSNANNPVVARECFRKDIWERSQRIDKLLCENGAGRYCRNLIRFIHDKKTAL